MLEEWGIKLTDDDLEKAKSSKDLFTLVHKRYAAKNKKMIWGNKTPRLTQHSIRLKKMYPKSVFIHMMRDPRAVALSLANSRIHKSNIYFGAKRWRRFVESGLRLEKRYKKDVLNILYEDLVTDPEKELSKICKFLNVKFHKNLLNYQRTGSSEYRAFHNKEHEGLLKEPYKMKIDAWRIKLKKEEIKVIESVCWPLMKGAGYKPIYKRCRIKESQILYYRSHRIIAFGFQVIHYLIYWPRYLFYTLYRKLILKTLVRELEITYRKSLLTKT